MPIPLTEADQIARKIIPILPAVVKEYDFGKYPADDYHLLKDQFAAVAAPRDSIEKALVWK